MITVETYRGRYDAEIAALILGIQNGEAKIDLSLDEQPDLKHIAASYQQPGGEFWLALDDEKLVGTLGLMRRENDCAVMKKFFVDKAYRAQKVGLRLYETLLDFARRTGVKHIILDTPSVATASHRFYERAGFRRITKAELPVPYDYPDRHSLLYLLELDDDGV